jgi:hypothetical protein
VTDRNAAQARQLIQALQEQLREMGPKLARAEREGAAAHPSRRRAMRLEAAALYRDITRAQFLIARLQRSFPGIAAEPAPRAGHRTLVPASTPSKARRSTVGQ